MPSKRTCQLRDACNANGMSCKNAHGKFLSDAEMEQKLQYGGEGDITADEVKRVLSPYFEGVTRDAINNTVNELTVLANRYPQVGHLGFYQKFLLDVVRSQLKGKYPHLK